MNRPVPASGNLAFTIQKSNAMLTNTTPDDSHNFVADFISAALLKCASREDYSKLIKMHAIEHLIPQITADLLSFAEKDPAAKQDPLLILKTYTSFSAVMHYRLSHCSHRKNSHINKNYLDHALPALLLQRGKIISGAEIHFLQ